jgi:glutathione peroxidase
MNFHDFNVLGIDGKEISLKDFKGKKVLVVNTASECGLTPQFAQLEELYKTFGPDRFVVIGFPSNDFGAQDPGTNEEIADFCTRNYGVSFPMMAKVKVIGESVHPLFDWLKQQANTEITWNFQKFIIDENGNCLTSMEPVTSPFDEKVLDWINSEAKTK